MQFYTKTPWLFLCLLFISFNCLNLRAPMGFVKMHDSQVFKKFNLTDSRETMPRMTIAQRTWVCTEYARTNNALEVLRRWPNRWPNIQPPSSMAIKTNKL